MGSRAQVGRDCHWPAANDRPSTLHEWLPETGRSIEHPDDGDIATDTVARPATPGRRRRSEPANGSRASWEAVSRWRAEVT